MKDIEVKRFFVLIGICFWIPMSFLFATPKDSLKQYIPFVSVEELPGFVFKSNRFFKRDNLDMKNAGFSGRSRPDPFWTPTGPGWTAYACPPAS